MARITTIGFETGANEGNSSLANAAISATARTGFYGMKIATAPTAGGLGYWSHNLGVNLTELWGRMAIRLGDGAITGGHGRIAFYNEDGAAVGYLLYDGPTQSWGFSLDGETILALGNGVMEANRWYVLEFHYLCSNGAGQFTLKVDGVTDLSYSGATSAQVTANVRRLQVRANTSVDPDSWYIDDLAINDPTGSFENTYPGLGGIFFQKANGDGTVKEFAPSVGTDHYACVDEVPPNTTDWVQGETSGEQELFHIENTPEYVTQINVVQPVWRAAVAVSGSNELRDIVRDGSTIYSGDTIQPVVSIAPAFVLYRGKTYYEQPDGVSGAFDATALDALQVGVEIP